MMNILVHLSSKEEKFEGVFIERDINEICHRSKKPSKLLASVREKGEMFRERLLLVKQRLLRNENFCPPSMQMTDSANFISVTMISAI